MIKEAITVFLSSMLPVLELRGAIPLGILLELPVWLVYVLAVVGNILPVVFLLWFWDFLLKKIFKIDSPYNLFSGEKSEIISSRWRLLGRLFYWFSGRTRQRFYTKYKRWGEWALVIFVAIPLPITGAWTGSVAAFLFGIPYKRALGLITLGVLISGVIVTLITLGFIQLV